MGNQPATPLTCYLCKREIVGRLIPFVSNGYGFEPGQIWLRELGAWQPICADCARNTRKSLKDAGEEGRVN